MRREDLGDLTDRHALVADRVQHRPGQRLAPSSRQAAAPFSRAKPIAVGMNPLSPLP
jgi:hypothetical protein